MGLWVIHDGKALRIKESYFDSRAERVQRTDEEHYTELERLTKGYYIQAVVVAPSAASFIETIRRHGKYLVIPADNDVLNGIRCVAKYVYDKGLTDKKDITIVSAGKIKYLKLTGSLACTLGTTRRRKIVSSRRTTTPWTTFAISAIRYWPR